MESESSDIVNDNNITEVSEALAADGDRKKSMEFAAELTEKGAKALKESDFAEAADCFSRALEIRAQHYGELAFECKDAYYQYGRALLYKAQEEADPLGKMPKKDDESKQEADKEGSVKSVVGESSAASLASNAEEDGDSNPQEETVDDASVVKDQEEEGGDSDEDDLAEADEDESDLDLAWKMLDIARAIAEKHSGDTIDKVDILSALAEVALEREDIDTSLNDYRNALSILERLVEPDSRLIAELNFRICLCLEIGSKPQEAIPYCEKAISVCKSRLQRLANEVKCSSEPVASADVPESVEGVRQPPSSSISDTSVADKEAEIETLSELAGELEKKLEDLHQLVRNPKSILEDILGLTSAKAKGDDKSKAPAVTSSSQIATVKSDEGFESSTVSTAHTNGATGVTHLGVVGRGVKRVVTNNSDSTPAKKPALDASADKGDDKST